MGRANQMDPNRGITEEAVGVVDEGLGVAYDVVRAVYETLAGINIVAANIAHIIAANDTLEALVEAMQLVADTTADAASALASKDAAAASAASAATSSTNATNQASAALANATASAVSAAAALVSQNAASVSAGTATSQAAISTSKAAEALTSANTASAGATTATTKAGEANASASAAAASETAAIAAKVLAEAARDSALAAYDNFDDRYLGTKTSDPVVDNDGNALVGGALYFSTATDPGLMKIYTGVTYGWVAAYVTGDGFAPADHNHDNSYYTETEIDTFIAGLEPVISNGTTAQYWRGDKTWQTLNKGVVGLGNVDNTADSAKPVSTAQQDALDLKLAATHAGTGGGAHADVVAAGASGFMTGAMATKLNGIVTGATANSADATLLARSNHTGTQSADTITDGTTNKAFTANEKTKLAGIASGATANSADATLLARANHTGTQAITTATFTTTSRVAGRVTAGSGIVEELTGTQVTALLNDATGSLPGRMTAAQFTKLAGIATGATANSSDATLLNRANHTGTQSADTLVDGTTNKAFTAVEDTKLAGIATGATANSADATLLARANHTGTQAVTTTTFTATSRVAGRITAGSGATEELTATQLTTLINDATGSLPGRMTAAQFTKLAGIATGATANSANATLLARANHTGTQSADTIVDGTTNKVLTAAEKLRVGSFCSVKEFGAVGNGTTDDYAAFAAAIASGASAIYIPPATYRLTAGITIPAGVMLYSEGALATNPPQGCVLLFDLSVATCVTLGGAAVSNVSCGIRGMNVSRATGTPPANCVGVLVQNVYNPVIQDVGSFRHQVCWKFKAGNVEGISASPRGLTSGAAFDAHIVIDTWPELRLSGSRFGMNGTGDQTCNAYIRMEGGSTSNAATGPNTLVITGCHFNQGANVPASFLRFASKTVGAISDMGHVMISDTHIEGYGNVFTSDSTWTTLNRLKVVNCHFNTSGNLFSLNAATTLDDVQIDNCYIAGGITIAPTNQFNNVSFSNNKIVGVGSITGVSSSTLTMIGNVWSANCTIAGSYGFVDIIGQKHTSGTTIISANGCPTHSWTPTLKIGGGTTGITYTTRQGAYHLNGRVVTMQFMIVLSSKGSLTGGLSIGGLPFLSNTNAWGSGGGSALPYTTNLASMTGPVMVSTTQGSADLNLFQQTSTGISQMTNANINNNTALAGNFSYLF